MMSQINDDRDWRYQSMEQRTDDDKEAGGDAYKHRIGIAFMATTALAACGIFDCGCTRDMAGRGWHDSFSAMQLEPAEIMPSSVKFTFGNGTKQKSIGKARLPGTKIEYEIIDGCDTPLLISNHTLRKTLGGKLDFKHDVLELTTSQIKLTVSSRGHYLLDLINFCGEEYFRGIHGQECYEMAEVFENQHMPIVEDEAMLETDTTPLPEPLPGVVRNKFKKPDLTKTRTVSIEQMTKLHKAKGHLDKDGMIRYLGYLNISGPEIEQMVSEAIGKCNGCV